MSLAIFDIKPVFTVPSTNEKILDLTQPSIRFSYDPEIIGIIVVKNEMSMRPDLISKAAYGTDNQWDLILKYNGYSNPFAIGVGDILLIPSIEDMSDQLAPNLTPDPIGDSIRKQYTDVSKKAQTDPKLAVIENKRKEAQRAQAQNIGLPSVSNLPPNIAESGDREIVIKGGKIYFGPNISKGKQSCEQPLSKSEFLSNLIKNRLNKGN